MDGGVHDAHVGAQEGRSRHGDVLVRCEHGVEHICHAVVGDFHVVLAVFIAVDDVEGESHRVGGVVHDVAELARNGIDERRLHQVVNEGHDDVARNRVDILVEVLDCVFTHTELVDEECTATARQEVFLDGFVGRNKHGSKVRKLVATHTIGVCVPSRVVAEQVGNLRVVRVDVQGFRTLRTLAEIAQLEDGVEELLAVGLRVVVVAIGECTIVVRSAETVDHSTEIVAVAIVADHFGEVSRRHEHVFQLVDVTILTGHIGLEDSVAEDVSRLLVVVVLRAGDDLEVAAVAACGDVVTNHLLGGEVHHHRVGSVHDEVDASVVEFLPIDIVFGHSSRSVDVGNRVVALSTDAVFQYDTLRQLSRHHRVGKHFHEDGVVEHRGVEQHFFHRLGQVFVLRHAPRIIPVEALEGFVVGGEDGL